MCQRQAAARQVDTHTHADWHSCHKPAGPALHSCSWAELARVQVSWPTTHHVRMHDGGAEHGFPLDVHPHVIPLQAVVDDLDGHYGALPASLQHVARLSCWPKASHSRHCSPCGCKLFLLMSTAILLDLKTSVVGGHIGQHGEPARHHGCGCSGQEVSLVQTCPSWKHGHLCSSAQACCKLACQSARSMQA